MKLWGDPRVTAFIDASGPLGRPRVAQRLAHEMDTQLRHGVQYWPMFLTSGELAGCAGLHRRDGEIAVDERGFHLCARSWGTSLATEVAQAVSALAFDHLGTVALFAGHHPENTASPRVLEKLGFRHTHDEHYGPTALLHPSSVLTASDRRGARDNA